MSYDVLLLCAVGSSIALVMPRSVSGVRRGGVIATEKQVEELVGRKLFLIPVAVVVLVTVVTRAVTWRRVARRRLIEELGPVVVVVLSLLCVAKYGESFADGLEGVSGAGRFVLFFKIGKLKKLFFFSKLLVIYLCFCPDEIEAPAFCRLFSDRHPWPTWARPEFRKSRDNSLF